MPREVDRRPSDAELVERANCGDAEAFEDLYRRHRDWVAAIAFRFTGNREDALDVLQDAFSYLFGKFPGFVLTSSLRTFLYPTVKHLSIDRRRPAVDIDDMEAELPQVPSVEAGAALGLSRALEELPAAQREMPLFVPDSRRPASSWGFEDRCGRRLERGKPATER